MIQIENPLANDLDLKREAKIIKENGIQPGEAANRNGRSGWTVVLAGTGVNLALGILYSWSIIAAYLRNEQGWSAIHAQLPYMIACGVFAFLMVPGGRTQDLIGPRKVIMAAAIFAGIGLLGSGFFIGVFGLTIFFGIFFGTAMGLGYSSATPPAIKWFGPEKRGLVAGIVVSGFGLASVYAAPLTNYLLTNFGLNVTFWSLGSAFFIIIIVLAQFISNPPAGYSINGIPSQAPIIDGIRAAKCSEEEFEWYEMMKSYQFYLLWLIFCFGSLAGLMIIGQLSSIVLEQSGFSLGFILVAILAVFNAVGRIIGGVLFDKLGRTKTMVIIFSAQAINFLLFASYSSLIALIIGTAIAGFCFGACLSVFPSVTALLYGVKNLGVNYGLVFTSWGAGGVFGGLIGGMVRDATGSYSSAFLVASVLCFIGIILSLLIKTPTKICD